MRGRPGCAEQQWDRRKGLSPTRGAQKPPEAVEHADPHPSKAWISIRRWYACSCKTGSTIIVVNSRK